LGLFYTIQGDTLVAGPGNPMESIFQVFMPGIWDIEFQPDSKAGRRLEIEISG
jgi:hypothetical protein